jgi:hypothetical protein
MHLRPVTKITFEQRPSDAFPNRTKKFVFGFATDYEASDSWTDLTNKAKITVPKNTYVRDENGKRVGLGNLNGGGFSLKDPLFMRGDHVTIEDGYKYRNKKGNEVQEVNTIFRGFISNVGAKKPIELECEDNMWLLKQTAAPNKVFPASKYTLEGILKELISQVNTQWGTPFTVNALTKTSFGDFRTQNETVAEVLARIRKDYHFESYFRGDELRSGSIVYIEAEAALQNFSFQQNIIEDELEYKRKDDILLSATAYSVNRFQTTSLTKTGHKKTKTERLTVWVAFRNGKLISEVKKSGEKKDFPVTERGESRTLYFWNVQTADELIKLAADELAKYYYTGLKGKFTTFGLPFVRQGDNAKITDSVLPERNGTYKIKSVDYKGGVSGLRQIINLDFKIS